MTERVNPSVEYPAVERQGSLLVRKVAHDARGRPTFQERLGGRPRSAGERFTIVHTVNDRPVRSYDIAIVEQQKADMSRPLSVVYEWTGKGFEGGMVISGGLYPAAYSGSARDAAAFLAVRAAPVVIGGVSGFVVGVVASIPATAAELGRVIVNARETVISRTVYEYDERGRIRFMKLYPPEEHAAELVKTEFTYAGDNDTPVRTDVRSLVENTVRTIR